MRTSSASAPSTNRILDGEGPRLAALGRVPGFEVPARDPLVDLGAAQIGGLGELLDGQGRGSWRIPLTLCQMYGYMTTDALSMVFVRRPETGLACAPKSSVMNDLEVEWRPSGKERCPRGLVRWQVDFTDQAGKRRSKLFPRRKDADVYLVKVRSLVANHTYLADSESITVAEAAKSWLEHCEVRWQDRAAHGAGDATRLQRLCAAAHHGSRGRHRRQADRPADPPPCERIPRPAAHQRALGAI